MKGHWKNNSLDNKPSYIFSPPTEWNKDAIETENNEYIEEICRENKTYTEKNEWIKEIKNIPEKLIAILLSEMKKGNFIKKISASDWPNRGSIVVVLANRFHNKNKNIPGTSWRELNDSHYCNEEISETYKDIEHILIC
ncbi:MULTISPECIES: hypothetical protein [unclassified Janthinobacterium]|uniref:hypothetical protein n=1 Tax=unclassified Janthinobacterium TaxID=2610881 RepID=UPI0016142D89|nr:MULTISPECIES: hypothetical protein [unclassified Janthinobacterium]MBB5606801.1 hypothetical protein [Janthinobacterium sp. S3T4]MBB5612149.1 hypothetical protein [Janthinobacterium sp. S3M3]